MSEKEKTVLSTIVKVVNGLDGSGSQHDFLRYAEGYADGVTAAGRKTEEEKKEDGQR